MERTLLAAARDAIALGEPGLRAPDSWPATIGLALAWLVLTVGYTPIADRLATRWVRKPPKLGAFRAIQKSKGGFIAGLYQGPRAALIVGQLSVLFGVPFVVGGYNLWTVILCHGLYDSIALVRFANRRSRYSNLPGGEAPSPGTVS